MNENKNLPAMDQSWSEAEKMLDKHFRKRRLIILLFSVILPAFIAGIILLMNHGKKENEKNILVSSSIKKSTELNHSLIKTEIAKTISSKIRETENNYSAQKNLLENKIIKTQINSDYKINLPKHKNRHSIDKNNFTSSPVQIKSSVSEKSLTNNSTANKLISLPPGSKAPSAIISSSDNHNYFPGNNSFQKITDDQIEKLPLLSVQLDVLKRDVAIGSSLPGKNLKSDGYHRIGFEAIVYSGASFIQKKVNVKSDWKNYLAHRTNEEESIITPVFGAAVSINKNALSLSIGFEYSISGEKTNYYPYSNQLTVINNANWQTYLRSIVDTDTAYVTGNQYFLHSTYFRLDSSLVSSHDTVEEYKYDKNIAARNGVNRIYFIEIPVEVSYCLTKGKLGFGISGGISPAIRIEEKGNYLRPDGRGIESFDEINSFRTFVINARVGADFYYRAGDRIKLSLRPQLRTNLNSVFKSEYGVNQKYYSTSLLFGVGYMLN